MFHQPKWVMSYRTPRLDANPVRYQGNLHCAFRPIIIMAQCFALFPVDNITASDASSLRFTWCSFRVLYSCIFFVAAMISSAFSFHLLVSARINSNRTSNLMYTVASALTSLLFLRLSRHWPSLMASWENLEREMATGIFLQPRASWSRHCKFKILTVGMMSVASVEHALFVLSRYLTNVNHIKVCENVDSVSNFFIVEFPQLFQSTRISYWKGFLSQFFTILCGFAWNFVDLFLILVSVTLVDQFKKLNHRLYYARGKVMPEWWWAEARTDYNRLARMTRQIDAHISPILLLSFVTNLYFICIQLFNSFKHIPSQIQIAYFCFSFSFVLVRTVVLSISAATIHDESRLPASELYSVFSVSYTKEVERFLEQVITDNVSLTGMNFFYITRRFILTVAGTIITFEIILNQFDAIKKDEFLSDWNITSICNESLAS